MLHTIIEILAVIIGAGLTWNFFARADAATVWHFDFQGGFEDTPVTLVVDGKLVFDRTITTDSETGLADRFYDSSEDRDIDVILKTPTTEVTDRLLFSNGSYVGIALKDGKGFIVQSKRFFFYD